MNDPNILHPAPVPIERFTWRYENGTLVDNQLVAEISDLNGYGRVYGDACDLGLTVISSSGREIVFAVEQEKRDSEGDLLWEILIIADARQRRELNNLTLRIFND